MTLAHLPGRGAATLCATLLVACSPAMDWRHMQLPGLGLSVHMPCRPDTHARTIDLAGRAATMRIHVCQERGTSFSVAVLELADPGQVGAALALLRHASARNVAGAQVSDRSAQVPGMTPHPEARQVHLAGHLPNGREVALHGLYFSHGTRVYQAVVMGQDMGAETVNTFLDGIRVLA